MTARPVQSPAADVGGVTVSACELGAAIGAEEDVAARLLAVAAEVIAKYAPDAPSGISNEAAIRFAAFLRNTTATAGLRGADVGSLRIEPMMGQSGAFHHSGAAGLLARFRRHRGGVIG